MEKELIQNRQLLVFHPKTSVTVICKGYVVSIGFGEITHISKFGGETVINTIANTYKTHHSLQELLNDLPVNEFVRINRSHIISLRHMTGVSIKRIPVGEYYVPVSKYYKDQLCKKLAMILDMNYHFYYKDE